MTSEELLSSKEKCVSIHLPKLQVYYIMMSVSYMPGENAMKHHMASM